MSRDNQQDQLDALILSYLDSSLNQAQFAKLVETMRNDPAALDRFVELASLDRSLQDTLTQGDQIQSMQQATVAQADPALSFEATLELLARGSESAQLVTLHHIKPSWHRYRLPLTIGGAIAAVLMIAVTLIINLQGPTPEPSSIADTLSPNMPAASAQPTPRGSDPQPTPTVATLTAEHNAVWASPQAEGALAPGSQLRASQRLTLTAGFAEITTADGAVAIIEAPAAIELTDNNNAIHLHNGKLVGICETDSSKGFLVRTPHLDITDLGTRFGIDATMADTVNIHVFEGEVQLRHRNASSNAHATRLVARQSARASASSKTITRIDHDGIGFASLLPTTIPLTGTGIGLKVGDTDPNWQVIAIDGKALVTPQLLSVDDNFHYTQHVANDPATAQWLSFMPDEQSGDEHTYLVRTTIDLPRSAAGNARVRMVYMADNAMRAVFVNGQRIELPESQWLNKYESLQEAVIDQHLEPGRNTIEFELINMKLHGKLSLSGLRVAWELLTLPSALNTNDTRPR